MAAPAEGRDLAQLVFYTIIIFPTFYCLIVHGRHGLLGWMYAVAMCLLRIVGNAIAFHAMVSDGTVNKVASILNGVGLLPLMMAALGLLHEA